MRTWKTADTRQADAYIVLTCPNCGNEAECPTYGKPGALITATIGTAIIFDPPNYTPPDDWMPEEIQCRICKTIYGV